MSSTELSCACCGKALSDRKHHVEAWRDQHPVIAVKVTNEPVTVDGVVLPTRARQDRFIAMTKKGGLK